jgi:hypothetical protein
MTNYDALEKRLTEDCYCGGSSNLSGVDCVPCRAAEAIHDLRAQRDALRDALEEWCADCFCQTDSIKHPDGCGRCADSRAALAAQEKKP